MNLQWLFEKPIAHRGLHDKDFPENSMPAYEKAIEHGYNIEIDVHLTSDKHLVVFHDDTLKRMCGVDKAIKDCTLAEIRNYKLANTEYTIPTFEEFLDLVNGQVGILCEIKGVLPWDLSIVKATIEWLKDYDGNIALQSFNFGAVAYARKHCNFPVGELCTWHGTKPEQHRSHLVDFMGKLWICKITKPHFIAYDVRALDKRYPENKYLNKWAKKLPILMWTVCSDETLDIALTHANNIIFERMSPDVIDLRIIEKMPFKCDIDKI